MARRLSTNSAVLRPLGVIAGFTALLLVTGSAGADDTHYRAVPIGAHAIGLGGAFTGVADDVSSTYFNPGGLALGGTVGLAAGLSINAWEREDLSRALAQPDGVANATTKTGRTVPIFVGAAIKFGPKDAWDEKRYSIAISLVEPIFSTGGVFFAFRTDPLALSNSYKINFNDRGTWYGISFASKLNLKQSIGASLYLSVRKKNHSETGLTLTGGMPVPGEDDVFVGTSTAANTQSLSFKAFHFVLRFGWLTRIKPQLQFGLMVQLPGIPLRQVVDTFSQGFFNDNQGMNTPTVTEAYWVQGRVNANLPLPAEIEGGLEYWPGENVMLALDASFHGPVRYRERVETGGDAPVGGLFFSTDTTRRPIGNVAVAGDFYIGKFVTIETGFFTDLSSAPKIPENPERYYDARVHRLGGTLSVGFNVGGIALAVGSTVLYGKGDATGAVVDLDNFVIDYTRTEAKSRIVYLHVTGATRAASDLSGKATQGIKAYRARKELEEEEKERRAREAEEMQDSSLPAAEEAGEQPAPASEEPEEQASPTTEDSR